MIKIEDDDNESNDDSLIVKLMMIILITHFNDEDVSCWFRTGITRHICLNPGQLTCNPDKENDFVSSHMVAM